MVIIRHGTFLIIATRIGDPIERTASNTAVVVRMAMMTVMPALIATLVIASKITTTVVMPAKKKRHTAMMARARWAAQGILQCNALLRRHQPGYREAMAGS
jgi:hypothetical protein